VALALKMLALMPSNLSEMRECGAGRNYLMYIVGCQCLKAVLLMVCRSWSWWRGKFIRWRQDARAYMGATSLCAAFPH